MLSIFVILCAYVAGYLVPMCFQNIPKLPGFFETFPELRFRWPKWMKDQKGRRKPCKTDRDCPFPLACCIHPILPGEKFCCSGWSRPLMVPQYAYAFLPKDGGDGGNRSTAVE